MPICNCCFLDKGEEDFHALEFGLRGFEPTSSLLIEEVCRDCLDLKDLIIMGPKNYRITNTSEYRKKVEANYIQNVLAADFSRDEIYSAKEMYNLYLDEKDADELLGYMRSFVRDVDSKYGKESI